MIVVMKSHANEAEIQNVVTMVEALAYHAHVIRGVERTVVACVGEERGAAHSLAHLESVGGVERVMPVLRSFKLASREVRPEGSQIDVGGVTIGGKRLTVIAGPCAVESQRQVEAAAVAVKQGGAHLLRGGAYKPRTSPYSFQGMENEGLRLLETAGRREGLPVVTEIMDAHDIEEVAEHSDMLQVGARNAQNFSLLRRLGKIQKPVLLKRGMSTRPRGICHGRRIYPLGRQPQCSFVRTRDSHLRNRDSQYARSERSPAPQGMDAPARDRGSEPWHRDLVTGEADGVGRHRGGC